MPDEQRPIFLGRDLMAHAVEPDERLTNVLVVTFGSLDTQIAAGVRGFGEEFLLKNGVSAIHILPRKKNWYQTAELNKVIELVVYEASRFAGIVTYGSSMGAYAALLCSNRIGARTVLAISPQFSIDAGKVPFEKRWRRFASQIDFVDDDVNAGIAPNARSLIFYDSIGPDAQQVRWIAAPRLERHPLPFSGHGTPGYLRDIGLLSSVTMAAITDNFDTRSFRAQVRSRRADSSIYWENMVYVTLGKPHRARLARVAFARLAALKAVNANVFVKIANMARRELPDLAEAAYFAAMTRGRMARDILPKLKSLYSRLSPNPMYEAHLVAAMNQLADEDEALRRTFASILHQMPNYLFSLTVSAAKQGHEKRAQHAYDQLVRFPHLTSVIFMRVGNHARATAPQLAEAAYFEALARGAAARDVLPRLAALYSVISPDPMQADQLAAALAASPSAEDVAAQMVRASIKRWDKVAGTRNHCG